MVFLRRICSSRPGDGDSADRAWQLSQLVEGVLTAFNPSHGSLSCVKTNCVSFASAQARKLNRSVCFSFPHKVATLWGPQLWPDIVCPNRLGGMMQPAKAAHGAFFSLAGSSLPPGLRARRALFPTCGVVRVAGYSVVWDCDPTPIFPLKSTKRSAAAISRSQRSFITFYGALRNILLPAGFSAVFHMITLEQTFVNGTFEK